MLEFSLLGVMLAGLLGGGHCVGMCGGIVGALTLSASSTRFSLLLAYNLGRLSSYTLIGMIAGAIGASSFFLHHILPVQKILYALASLMLVLMGLYLAGFSAMLTRLENIGGMVWQRIQPLGKRFIPAKNTYQAYCLGLVWGWLPCGLVYSMLISALATANALQGGLIMLCFGLGTLPNLLLMGMAGLRLRKLLQHPRIRVFCGVSVALMGIWGLWVLLR